ncbi:methyltransferase [Acidocella sp.]|uniref:methyltransferase n=1 Tax=Acidocella sp. TaxID=50710 RepID=UPI002F41856B
MSNVDVPEPLGAAAGMKERISASFSARAADYDHVASVQPWVAHRLATRIAAALSTPPKRILEIGCGTGLLSTHLASLYPLAELVVTDISPVMLERARLRLGSRASYRHMDGEAPDTTLGGFDLIASSLAMQWFADLRGGIARLADLLSPGGRFVFATLGAESFAEWRAAHETLGFRPGLHPYPSVDSFPWPEHCAGTIEVETIRDHHVTGHAFARSLKDLGAGQPAPGHKPLTPAQFRQVLKPFQAGCTASYQVVYGMLHGP